jgi:hypothetical protein
MDFLSNKKEFKKKALRTFEARLMADLAMCELKFYPFTEKRSRVCKQRSLSRRSLNVWDFVKLSLLALKV